MAEISPKSETGTVQSSFSLKKEHVLSPVLSLQSGFYMPRKAAQILRIVMCYNIDTSKFHLHFSFISSTTISLKFGFWILTNMMLQKIRAYAALFPILIHRNLLGNDLNKLNRINESFLVLLLLPYYLVVYPNFWYPVIIKTQSIPSTAITTKSDSTSHQTSHSSLLCIPGTTCQPMGHPNSLPE